MKKIMRSRKEKETVQEDLLNPDVVVKLGVETERLIPMLKKYLVPEEYSHRIEIVLRSREAFQEAYGEYIFLRSFELMLNEISSEVSDMVYPCKCEVCGKIQNMIVPIENPLTGERALPNWRESIICPECACSNHLRFFIGKIRKEYEKGMNVLLYEYGSTLYQFVKHYIPDVTACECTGKEYKNIEEGEKVLYENPSALSIPTESFSLVIANDLWEKVSDKEGALKEAARIVKKGGKLIFTTVFNANSLETHDGVFGWDILQKMKLYGFSDAYVKADFSIEEGYLGYLPMYFEAVK